MGGQRHSERQGEGEGQGGRWVDLREAAEALGTSTEAVRKRAARGTLQSRKGEDGRVYVRVDTVHPSDRTTSGQGDPEARVEGSASEPLVEELRDRVRSLEGMLEAERAARTEERRRHDMLLARLMDRIPELETSEAPEASSETAPPEPQGGQESHEEASEGSSVRQGVETGEADSGPGPGEASAGVRSPWWRRIFGRDL